MIWLVQPMSREKMKKEPEAMTDSDKKFNWTGKHQEALDLLKTHLMSVLLLGYPDFSRPFDLDNDASLQGLGCSFISMGMSMARAGLSHITVGPCSPVKEQ